jgi:hypothetical protein
MDNEKFKRLVNENIDKYFQKKETNKIFNDILNDNAYTYKNNLKSKNINLSEDRSIEIIKKHNENKNKDKNSYIKKGGANNNYTSKIIQDELNIIKKEQSKVDSDMKSIIKSIKYTV